MALAFEKISLFDTGKIRAFFPGSQKFKILYLTLGLSLVAKMKLPSILSCDGLSGS